MRALGGRGTLTSGRPAAGVAGRGCHTERTAGDMSNAVDSVGTRQAPAAPQQRQPRPAEAQPAQARPAKVPQ
jgi:hypothetical protein